MKTINYKDIIKKERSHITRPSDLIYQTFSKLDLFNKGPKDFQTNFSEYVEKTRALAWDDFLEEENQFRAECYRKLFAGDKIDIHSANELSKFVAKYTEQIFELAKSDTNSRRSRSGKEFEAIIELMLMGSNIFMDSQGNIGKASFSEKGLGKLVDFVTPTSVHFQANKRKTLLISLKTTLRERWSEVVEEKNRTASQTMFLATMDENITKDVVERLDQNNVTLVVTINNKKNNYPNNNKILVFEDMVQELLENQSSWRDSDLSIQQLREVILHFGKLRENNPDKKFVISYSEWAMDYFTELTKKLS